MAPIIVFAFNRPDSLQRAVEALAANEEAKESDLYVFVDGPRSHKEGEAAKVEAVREYAKNIKGFRSLTCSFAETNKGLAPSIISGVSQVIERHGSAIVVEDDLVVSRSFLRYMNAMLVHFKDDERVMQISGFGCKIDKPKDYPWDVYLNERAQCWTWATWEDRWQTIDWEVADFNKLKSSWHLRRRFGKSGSDLFGMLNRYMKGKVSSWFIRFHYSMHKQQRYAVYPFKSLVRNEGFSSDATNCDAYNRYAITFEDLHEGDFKVPDGQLMPVERIMREAVKYWTIRWRIYGKFMYYLKKIVK